jgi:hypothetical protein
MWLACRAELCGHKVPGATGDLVFAQIGELDWWCEMRLILADARAVLSLSPEVGEQ